MNLTINVGSDTPIYKQITDQVRLAVATGKLVIHDQLPSVRALAEELLLNPNTVARAYSDLAREGIIQARPGRGAFIICKRKVFSRDESRRRIEPLLDSLIGEALATDLTPDDLRAAFEKKLKQWKEPKGVF